MPDEPNCKLKYKWRKTWPDPSDSASWQTDYCGWDGKIMVGRIRFQQNGPKKDFWQWSGHGGPKAWPRLMPQQGYCTSAREAAAKCEEYYDKLNVDPRLP
ncbi:hypothetical protein [Rhizobium tubonense]|uniref:Uncharacterized protein n=1 Tax=Rhizobium tubonense TaxID=484088 RepID=A0A2W4DJV0_9HYPH|nr:hypothetical protein [Rhizobium tubonense]PZM16464.1 hypothetical protein CPY51_03800 [Rhizobium tubonense]